MRRSLIILLLLSNLLGSDLHDTTKNTSKESAGLPKQQDAARLGNASLPFIEKEGSSKSPQSDVQHPDTKEHSQVTEPATTPHGVADSSVEAHLHSPSEELIPAPVTMLPKDPQQRRRLSIDSPVPHPVQDRRKIARSGRPYIPAPKSGRRNASQPYPMPERPGASSPEESPPRFEGELPVHQIGIPRQYMGPPSSTTMLGRFQYSTLPSLQTSFQRKVPYGAERILRESAESNPSRDARLRRMSVSRAQEQQNLDDTNRSSVGRQTPVTPTTEKTQAQPVFKEPQRVRSFELRETLAPRRKSQEKVLSAIGKFGSRRSSKPLNVEGSSDNASLPSQTSVEETFQGRRIPPPRPTSAPITEQVPLRSKPLTSVFSQSTSELSSPTHPSQGSTRKKSPREKHGIFSINRYFKPQATPPRIGRKEGTLPAQKAAKPPVDPTKITGKETPRRRRSIEPPHAQKPVPPIQRSQSVALGATLSSSEPQQHRGWWKQELQNKLENEERELKTRSTPRASPRQGPRLQRTPESSASRSLPPMTPPMPSPSQTPKRRESLGPVALLTMGGLTKDKRFTAPLSRRSKYSSLSDVRQYVQKKEAGDLSPISSLPNVAERMRERWGSELRRPRSMAPEKINRLHSSLSRSSSSSDLMRLTRPSTRPRRTENRIEEESENEEEALEDLDMGVSSPHQPRSRELASSSKLSDTDSSPSLTPVFEEKESEETPDLDPREALQYALSIVRTTVEGEIPVRLPEEKVTIQPRQDFVRELLLVDGLADDTLSARQAILGQHVRHILTPQRYFLSVCKNYLPGIAYIIHELPPLEGYYGTPIATFKPVNLEMGTTMFRKYHSGYKFAFHRAFPKGQGVHREIAAHRLNPIVNAMTAVRVGFRIPTGLPLRIGGLGGGYLQERVLPVTVPDFHHPMSLDYMVDCQMNHIFNLLTMNSYTQGTIYGHIRELLTAGVIAQEQTHAAQTFFRPGLYSTNNAYILPDTEKMLSITDLSLRLTRTPYLDIPFLPPVDAFLRALKMDQFQELLENLKFSPTIQTNVQIAIRVIQACALRGLTPIQAMRFLYTQRPVNFFAILYIRLPRENGAFSEEQWQHFERILDHSLNEIFVPNAYHCDTIAQPDYSKSPRGLEVCPSRLRTGPDGQLIDRSAVSWGRALTHYEGDEKVIPSAYTKMAFEHTVSGSKISWWRRWLYNIKQFLRPYVWNFRRLMREEYRW